MKMKMKYIKINYKFIKHLILKAKTWEREERMKGKKKNLSINDLTLLTVCLNRAKKSTKSRKYFVFVSVLYFHARKNIKN